MCCSGYGYTEYGQPGGVNPTMLAGLRERLREINAVQRATFVVIEHNMEFVMSLCTPSVYSQDGRRARAIAREITCGTVNINEAFAASFGSIDSPMGGMRESGMGRRQGGEGVHRYTESQTVATQRGMRFSPMFGMSDRTYAKVMTAQLRLMKKLGRA